MNAEIKVPAVGESITEGVIAEWQVDDGEFVESDDPIFELETDKVTMIIASEHSGKISIKVEAGAKVEIGQVVATVDTEVVPEEVPQREETVEDPAEATAEPEEKAPPISEPAGVPQMRGKSKAIREKVGLLSPSVRRLLVENDLDPRQISGTGRDGRLTVEDVNEYLRAGAKRRERPLDEVGARDEADRSTRSPETLFAAAVDESAEQRQTRKPMSSLRQRVAERLVQVQQNAAILTTFNEADMTGVIEMRRRYKEPFEKRHGIKLGFMSFFVKASVEALKAVPEVNAMIEGQDIVYNHYYDIGVAISTDKGLIVPVIRDVDKKTFAGIELAIADFGSRARDKTLTLDDLSGGVFTVSNGGIFGSMLSTPILNPPQSAILGMHAIKKRAMVADDDNIAVRPMMYLALSYDHRLIDGREAVSFLGTIVDCIERPERMMLGV